MRVAAYIRVSTDKQAEKGNSILEQQERTIAYCKALRWESPVFFIDEGYSAKTLNRPAMTKLLKDVGERKFDAVLNTKLDRLCRNLLDLLHTVEHFQTYDCAYVSISEGFDTSTAVGRMTMQVLGAFAEFERERTSERVKDNMISIAKNSDKALTKPCFGYDVVDSRYVINEKEAAHVLYMRDMIFQGAGLRRIAKLLNDMGVRTKKGAEWDSVNVRRLVLNETLCGTRITNKRMTKNGKTIFRPKSEWIITENNHPAILPKEDTEKIHAIIKKNASVRKHVENESFILTGLLVCEYCGKLMTGSSSRNVRGDKIYEYYRYLCSSYTRKAGCKYHAVHRDDIEKSVIHQIWTLSQQSSKDIVISGNTKSKEEERQALNNALTKTDRKMQKQIEAYESDLISGDDLKKARQRVDAEREKLRLELKRLDDKKSDVSKLKQTATSLWNDISGLDRLRSKAALARIIDHIRLKDGEYSIVWKS